jgi:hypothetical protein
VSGDDFTDSSVIARLHQRGAAKILTPAMCKTRCVRFDYFQTPLKPAVRTCVPASGVMIHCGVTMQQYTYPAWSQRATTVHD